MIKPYAEQNQLSMMNAPANKAEGWALVELARRMEKAKQSPDDKEAMRDIVRMNWRVWTIIQSAMLDPENTVPVDVRSNLVNLSNFIDKRSVDIIAAPSIDKLDVLVNINRQVGAGLLGSASDSDLDEKTAQAEQEGGENDLLNQASQSISPNKNNQNNKNESAITYSNKRPTINQQSPPPSQNENSIADNQTKDIPTTDTPITENQTIQQPPPTSTSQESSTQSPQSSKNNDKPANEDDDFEARKRQKREEAMRQILGRRSPKS